MDGVGSDPGTQQHSSNEDVHGKFSSNPAPLHFEILNLLHISVPC